jgi:predicted alpha/beta hydrolase
MNVADIRVPALDGEMLEATLYEPNEMRAAIVVSSATATPRGFYRAFCERLCADGAAVVSYDYRGTAGTPEVLRRSSARMRDWGERDFPGVVEWMSARYPEFPLQTVGHSVGGHVLLMAPNNRKVTRAVLIASQSGYWRLYRGFEQVRVYAFMKAIMPLFTRVNGYFPGSRLAFGLDLAPGVLYEWSRWCRAPGFFFDDASLDSLANARTYTAPTRMIGLTDDPWGTPRALDALQAGFIAAPVERIEIDPSSVRLSEIGHMGFFRARNASCWKYATEFLSMGSFVS